MSKIDDALLQIESIKDWTERAMTLGGLVATVLKLKGVTPIIVGRLAYDTYVGNSYEQEELILATLSGHLTPRIMQEVFSEQLHGTGMIWKWKIANTTVKLGGDAVLSRKELCRDFQTDFGVVKLIPAEELIAERILASVYPKLNQQARFEAKRLLTLGLAESLVIDWQALQELCASEPYRTGEQLALLRTEAKSDVDAVMAAEQAPGTPASAADSDSSPTGGATASVGVDSDAPASAA